MYEKKRKRGACALLAAALCLGMSISAVSSQDPEPGTETVTETVSESVSESASGTEILGDDLTAGWHIVTENVQINDSLENISVALGYSGVQTSEFVKSADEGNTFCMVKLLIEKQGSKEAIDWENMCLTDGEGNEYHRIEDEFILDLGMKRMPGTKLNFGSNEGWIAFEIPEKAEDLTISYAFEEETYSCELTNHS